MKHHMRMGEKRTSYVRIFKNWNENINVWMNKSQNLNTVGIVTACAFSSETGLIISLKFVQIQGDLLSRITTFFGPFFVRENKNQNWAFNFNIEVSTKAMFYIIFFFMPSVSWNFLQTKIWFFFSSIFHSN